MEEHQKPDESANGDQVAIIDAPQDPSITIVPAEEHDGGKFVASEDTLMEEKSVEPSENTDSAVKEPEKNSIEKQTSVEQKVVPNAPVVDSPLNVPNETVSESAEVTADTQLTADTEVVDKELKGTVDIIESTVAEESFEKETEKDTESTNNTQETVSNMDPPLAPIAQAMDVEEPAAPAVPVAIVSIQEQVAEEQKLESEAVEKIANSSLSMLCQYSGSSDSEGEETDASNVVAGAKVSSESSSSSSDESDVEITKEMPPTSAGAYRMQDDPILVSDAETMDTNAASSEDEEDEPIMGPIRTAGEILPHELPPIEELTITVPETECKPIGHIESIVAQIVLVQSVAGAELLNLDTVLFLDRGKRALGKIFDVIGQVNQPIYCILFNSNQEIVSKNITTGMEVFCAPRTEYTSFIILSELMRTKGSDASWMNDNEIPSYMAEHSDDEAERAAKRNRKKNAANRPHGTQNDGDGSEMGDEHNQSQQHPHYRNPRQPSPSTSRPQQYQRGNGGRQFNPRYPSGTSWHHNYNPRYGQPQQQYRPRFPPRHQQFQQYQQIPHMQPPPQGGMVLPNPFSTPGQHPRQPHSGSN